MQQVNDNDATLQRHSLHKSIKMHFLIIVFIILSCIHGFGQKLEIEQAENILGVGPKASKNEIIAAYRKKMAGWNRFKYIGNSDLADQNMKMIHLAFQRLIPIPSELSASKGSEESAMPFKSETGNSQITRSNSIKSASQPPPLHDISNNPYHLELIKEARMELGVTSSATRNEIDQAFQKKLEELKQFKEMKGFAKTAERGIEKLKRSYEIVISSKLPAPKLLKESSDSIRPTTTHDMKQKAIQLKSLYANTFKKLKAAYFSINDNAREVDSATIINYWSVFSIKIWESFANSKKLKDLFPFGVEIRQDRNSAEINWKVLKDSTPLNIKIQRSADLDFQFSATLYFDDTLELTVSKQATSRFKQCMLSHKLFFSCRYNIQDKEVLYDFRQHSGDTYKNLKYDKSAYFNWLFGQTENDELEEYFIRTVVINSIVKRNG